MDIMEIIKTIKEDWAILVFFFALGGAWWQGKMWFKEVNSTLGFIKETSSNNNNEISKLHQKMDHLHDRVNNLEKTIESIREEQHNQEIKLAVLESSSTPKRARG